MKTLRAAAVLGVVALLTAGCTLASSNGNTASTVTLVTHDSWAAPQQLLDAFQQQTGIRLQIIKKGDAGALTTTLVLTKASPIGDLAYGVDSTLASRALSEGVFESYTSPEADRGPQRYAVDSEHRLSAVDLGDVCLNVDTGWFTQRNIPVPTGYEDLTDAKYRDLLVVEDPATSSPGLAFLLGTIAKYGEPGWRDYWAKLKDNGVKTDSGWEEAYSQDFSGSSGKGSRPIVVSYASSPAAEVGEDGKPRTKALLDTCYRQVEYAGVLAGTKQADKAHKVIDFLLSQQFQSSVPENMYVYPTRQGVNLPAGWAQVAPSAPNPATLPGDRVRGGREQWIQQWRSLVGR